MPHHACINICMPMGNGTLSFTWLIGIPSLIYIYIYKYIYRGARFRYRCCSLDFSLKILLCGFFFINGSVFFKLSNHMTES